MAKQAATQIPQSTSQAPVPILLGMGALSSSHRQAGNGLIEFSLISGLVLAVGMGIVETAHWFSVRQVISLALVEAARAGAVSHGNPHTMSAAFEHGLTPLFAVHRDPAHGRQASLARTQAELGQPWHIHQSSPHPQAYADFPAPDNTPWHAPRGLKLLDNDYLAEQHQRYLARGWPKGQGPLSGQTIFQANTLSLTLTYPHRPLLLSTRALLRLLPGGQDTFAAQALRQGYLPMRRQASIAMQSHPAQWLNLPVGMTAGHATTWPDSAVQHPCTTCLPLPETGVPMPPVTGSAPPGSLITDMPGTPPVPDPALGSISPEQGNGPDEALCGIALCCES